ncbi:MAG: PAS-domain containing protein [Proteobacteria bacterium]|nr:PAS-domain containing protein [Pseudomonadota bacterium]
MLGALWPVPAEAATGAEVAIFSATAGALLAGLIGAALAAYNTRRRLDILISETENATRRAAGAEALVAGTPAGFCSWSVAGGPEIIGPTLATVLGAKATEIGDLSDVMARLAGDDAARLEDAVGRLRNAGEEFRLTLASLDGERAFEATGKRAGGSGGEPLADMVWFHDVSERAREIRDLSGSVASLIAKGEEFRRLLDLVDVPIWLRDPDLELVDCNGAFARAVDAASPAAAIEERREIAGGPTGWGKELAARAKDSGAAETQSIHTVIDGQRRLLEITELPIAETGSIAGFALDRTELEQAEDKMTRHVAAHGEVLEKLGTAIVIYGADTTLNFFNSTYAKLWGLDEEWLRTEPTQGEILEELRIHRRLPEQADFRAYKAAQSDLFTSLIEPLEELLHLPDERVLRMVVNPHPLGGLLYTYEDVTDRMTLERSYNTLIAVQQESLNHLLEAVAVFGGDGRLKLHNPAYQRMWRFETEMLETEPRLTELVEAAKDLFNSGDDWEAFKAKVISRATDHSPRTGRFERTDGTILDYASVPLPDGAVLFSYLDVTDSIKVERALRERNEALETADRLKSEFIASVSYALRTPLTSIIGFTEILTNEYFGKLQPRQVEYTHGILESSRQLLGLIDDILDLAMIEAGQLALDLQPVDIHDMMTSVLGLAKQRSGNQRITIELDCADDIGEMVADGRRLKQALFNLLSNSIRYTPEDGTITLSARRKDGDVFLEVADTGVGIDEEDQARIFEKFEHGARSEGVSTGIGLGLALVKSFVELHGGDVELKSKPGKGATVTCRLPAEPRVDSTPDLASNA